MRLRPASERRLLLVTTNSPPCVCYHMQIFGKGAKFSMFKPAEEMVYIGLDEESRTKGKAAIDVVGAQSGKSLGSVLQQALLLATGGALAGACHGIPVLLCIGIGRPETIVVSARHVFTCS